MTGPTPEPLEIKGELKMPDVQARHPGLAKFVAGVVFSVGLLSGLPALAECVPNNFSNNWLQNQENAGGPARSGLGPLADFLAPARQPLQATVSPAESQGAGHGRAITRASTIDVTIRRSLDSGSA